MNKFYEYLSQIRPTTNAVALNTAAKIPKNTLGKHYRWADGKPQGIAFPMRYAGRVVRALCASYGRIEIGGFVIESLPEGAFITSKKNGAPIQQEGEFDNLYLQPQYVSIWDEADFCEFLSKMV